jgi:rod shape determining protein RodA
MGGATSIRLHSPRPGDRSSPSTLAAWRHFDPQLTACAALLAAMGLAMAYSNSVEAGRSLGQASPIFVRAVLWTSVAAAVFVALTSFDYRWLRTFAWPLYFAQLALLGLTLVLGEGAGGTARWISVGPIAFQFSEVAKILMILVLANYLASRSGRLGSLASILGAVALVIPAWVLVMVQPDLGTSLVFAAILAAMLFMSGASLRWLAVLAGLLAAAVPIAWTYLLRDYQRARLTSFLNPAADIHGPGYQLYQAQAAIGSGGWMGKGLTNGTQSQLDFLPVQATDFVYALLAEELGFIGGMVVLALFAALLWRILVAGWRSPDAFGTMVCCGVASMILFQLVVNVGMVIGVMPITGIPLPFVTHGGASLVTTAAGLGIIQSINVRRTRAAW